MSIDEPANPDDGIQHGIAGQYFHVEFGFVRRSTYNVKQENGPTLTSTDGYNSYLIIVDMVTIYI